MPKPKKVAVLKPKVLKNHFFLPREQQEFEDPSKMTPVNAAIPQVIMPQREIKRHFLFNNLTGEAYAEWINNEAVCLETGMVLFRSRNKTNEDMEMYEEGNWRKYDFRVPDFRRVDDPTIYTEDLIQDGVITVEDFRMNGAALTLERVKTWMTTKKSSGSEK
jgi:uncharacterized protein YacL (UPF0231 family)